MAGQNPKRSMTKRAKKARGAARKTVRGVLPFTEKDLVAGLNPRKAHADELDSGAAKKRGKRPREEIGRRARRPKKRAGRIHLAHERADGLRAARQIGTIKRLVGAGLRHGGSVVLVSRRTDAGKPRTAGKPRAKKGDKGWDAFQAMLDRPARRKPKLVRLLKTKAPWE